jgi:hypothetical protein
MMDSSVLQRPLAAGPETDWMTVPSPNAQVWTAGAAALAVTGWLLGAGELGWVGVGVVVGAGVVVVAGAGVVMVVGAGVALAGAVDFEFDVVLLGETMAPIVAITIRTPTAMPDQSRMRTGRLRVCFVLAAACFSSSNRLAG